MIKKTSLVMLTATMLIILAGCQSPTPFDSTGIPTNKYLVGGGFELKYTAPVDGTVYAVDRGSYKMLGTESLKAGKTFDQSFDPTSQSIKEGFKAVGIDLSRVRIQLYFVPDADMPVAKRKLFMPKNTENSVGKCKTEKGKQND